MKWLITLVVGIVVGAGAVLFYLGALPLQSVPPAPVIAAVPASPAVTEPATPPPPAPAPPGTDVALPASSLPPVTAPAIAPEAALPAVPLTVIGSPPGASPSSSQGSPSGSPSGLPSGLLIPVAHITAAQLTDTFGQARGSERQHEALDIMAPKGTPVYAVADGKLVKLFKSKPGGITLYQFDPTEKYAYYYAHLERYAAGIKEGQELKRGQLIGYVGVTGNSDPAAPHLHFAIFELEAKKEWWKGTPINPYPLMTGK